MLVSVMLRGLNHITLAVSDLERSIAFYRDVLGMTMRYQWDEGAYLECGPLWLCLSYDENCRAEPHADYTHTAFDVVAEDFKAMAERIRQSGATEWRSNKSEGDSHYFLDPDGHKLEIHVGDLESRLKHYAARELK